MKLALRILAWIVAVIGWVILLAIAGTMLVVICGAAYQGIVDHGLWGTAKEIGLFIVGLVVLFGGFGIWAVACEYARHGRVDF